AQDFIDKITKVADKRAKADYAQLLARKKKDDPKAKVVDQSESVYYEELVKKEKYHFDSQEARPYFEFQQTLEGLLGIMSKMFGVEFTPVKDAVVWHPDVQVFDVMQKGQKLGRIYL